jgi:hypothetical protein
VHVDEALHGVDQYSPASAAEQDPAAIRMSECSVISSQTHVPLSCIGENGASAKLWRKRGSGQPRTRMFVLVSLRVGPCAGGRSAC